NTENMNHAISVWNYTKKYSALVIKYAFVAYFIIHEFMMSVRYEEAFSFCQGFLNLLNTLSHDNNIVRHHLSMIKNTMGLIHMEQGNYNIAGEIFQKVLNEIIAGPYYLESIAVADNVGYAFCHQGKYEESLKYYHIALDTLLANDGYFNKNIEILNIQSDIAIVFCKQGKYDIALQMLREIYTTQKQILGENHFHTLHTQNIVASIFVEQGKYSEALRMLQEAYDIISKTLNQCHPFILTLKSNIGAVLFKQGKSVEAINVIEEVLNLQKQVLSSDHPEILATRNAIAQTLVEQGKCDE
ncbi:PREDICTED: kinesin light chain-like, partial [Eufriesea mexicana]|uniref:kinesin light chain-like n=1 Tax=Eufriesea mexicana TaxID=516756 RepID=UPI00083C6B48